MGRELPGADNGPPELCSVYWQEKSGQTEGDPGGRPSSMVRGGSRVPQENPCLYQGLTNVWCRLHFHSHPTPVLYRDMYRIGQILGRETGFYRLSWTRRPQKALETKHHLPSFSTTCPVDGCGFTVRFLATQTSTRPELSSCLFLTFSLPTGRGSSGPLPATLLACEAGPRLGLNRRLRSSCWVGADAVPDALCLNQFIRRPGFRVRVCWPL